MIFFLKMILFIGFVALFGCSPGYSIKAPAEVGSTLVTSAESEPASRDALRPIIFEVTWQGTPFGNFENSRIEFISRNAEGLLSFSWDQFVDQYAMSACSQNQMSEIDVSSKHEAMVCSTDWAKWNPAFVRASVNGEERSLTSWPSFHTTSENIGIELRF